MLPESPPIDNFSLGKCRNGLDAGEGTVLGGVMQKAVACGVARVVQVLS